VTAAALVRRVRGSTLASHGLLTVAGGVLLYLLTTGISDFRNYQLATVGFYVIAVAGLTVLTGMNGQISLGHGALMAVGAYITALLTLKQGWPLFPAMLAAIAGTALVGVVVGAAAARLRGPYLAGATLALAVGVPPLATRFPGFFGGETGLSVNTGEPMSWTTSPSRWQAWIACLAALVTLFLLANLKRSRIGRSFRAVRDDEIAASLAGLSVPRVQVLAFVVSAACCGLAGAVFGVVIGLVSPGGFPLTLSLALLTGMVLGGLGSLTGAVWGSLILVYLPTLTQNIGSNPTRAANISIMVYGALLALVMLVFPGGIQGGLSLLWRRFRPRGGRPAATTEAPGRDPRPVHHQVTGSAEPASTREDTR
jgi:branched-chain amino acid transport system permease protein